MFLTLLLLAAVFVASELLRPKPKTENARPAGLGDFRFPTATQGRPVPILWGTCMIDGPNVVWYGDLKQEAIKVKQKTGLFSSTTVIRGYKYNVGVQMAVSRGFDTVQRVLIGDREVFAGSQGAGTITINKPDLLGGDELGAGGVVGTLRVHVGTAAQAANAYLAPFQTVSGQQIRYKGTAYFVFEGGYIGNSTSIDPWKFECRRIPNGLALGTPSVNSGNDANPANVLYELYTDAEFGLGVDPTKIDTANWTTAANTLRTEGNGFSLLLDNTTAAVDLIQEIERQIDGTVFMNQNTGKFQIKLARNDYNILTVPQLTDPIEVSDFSRGAWEDTTNQVRVQFNNRLIEYGEDYGLAQDMANAQIQGGGTVTSGVNISVTIRYPGVKDSSLANQLAWRDLRTLSYPLAKATFVVDRNFWDITPWEVLAWTDTKRGFVKLPMRVQRVDYGDLIDGKITLDCVQDVFQFAAGSYAPPPATGWTPPSDTLVAFPSGQQKAIEAPRALVMRDPAGSGSVEDKVFCGARRQNNEVSYKIMARHAVGAPAGSFNEIGEVFGFVRLGQLKANLAAGSVFPLSTLLLTATPDTQAILEAAFVDAPDPTDQGTNLINLIMVDDEFMLAGGASISGADVQLDNTYRGVLDSAQVAHLANATVWLLFVGSGLSSSVIPPTNNVEVKLLPRSTTNQLAVGSATAIAFTMDNRVRRPYAPGSMSLNTTLFPSTTSLDAAGGGSPEITGIPMTWIRRDYRTADGGNEVQALTVDAASIFADFPAANNTTHDVEVRNDPNGTNTLLFSELGLTGASKDILRIKILRFTDGAVPSRMRLSIKSKHDYETLTGLFSRSSLVFDFNTTSPALAGFFNFGARAASVVSNTYAAVQPGTYNFGLSTAFTAGNVQYSLNGGGFVNLITAGNTSGSIVGVIATDTIRLQHTSTDVGAIKQVTMTAPGGGQNGYFIAYV